MRFKFTHIAVLCVALFVPVNTAIAEEVSLFRIGTGGVGGTYYPVGKTIARMLSNPLGKEDCTPDPCGVPYLLSLAQTANGSVSNIEDIQSGKIESGLAQSDIVYWARTGTGIFDETGPFQDITAIASLYREDIHLVARKDADIRSVSDLRGKRVSLDDPGSGTLVDARLILDAFGVRESEFEAQYIKAADAIKKMRAGQLDAFFLVAGSPSKAIAELSEEGLITLVPIDGPTATMLSRENTFFSTSVIKAGSYKGVDMVRTLCVTALWIVDRRQSEEEVYEITKTFWRNLPAIKKMNLHPKLSKISMGTTFASMSVALHPGAQKYYREIRENVADTRTN
ncbi:TAXI family TRAP transporter solute-binding subunit [Sneathiella sp. HT1-7]|uniref:TAXI family TRAP transporter solute-binding subunit n=1 Tax=Sneathiella sp. HT1-7 TaxID=2887192 RepID=UPI001D150475|nr:TAXI family TRAP transporter solute-binding subunit [Sneathiella sp. HT1-7]MCC3305377.1 TAXI family TRAP transporter solute-binding subunit [Sneathiella sp. HT1-7]